MTPPTRPTGSRFPARVTLSPVAVNQYRRWPVVALTNPCTYGMSLGSSRSPRIRMATLFSWPKSIGVEMLYFVHELKTISASDEQFGRSARTAAASSTPCPPKGTLCRGG